MTSNHSKVNQKSSTGKIQIPKKKKIAFVCSGGAVKAGAFHIGVALAMREFGFRFQGGLDKPPKDQNSPLTIDTYVGSSAGSMISTFLASGYTIEEISASFLDQDQSESARPLPRLSYSDIFKLRPEAAKEQLAQFLTLKTTVKKLIRGKWEALLNTDWLKTTGFFSTHGIETYMRESVLPSNRFEDYASDLYVIGTQLNHSRKVVFGRNRFDPPPHDPSCRYLMHVKVSDAVAASTALPPFYSPYEIQNVAGKKLHYIDGEIRDTLSTHVAVDSGADLVIASYTHQPYHYVKNIGSLMQMGIPAILMQSLYLMIEQKINQYVHNKRNQKQAIEKVEDYCKKHQINHEHRREILRILEEQFSYRKNVDTIYIHPRPSDARMFFQPHFSLDPSSLNEIVRSGFRAAGEVLRHYDFQT